MTVWRCRCVSCERGWVDTINGRGCPFCGSFEVSRLKDPWCSREQEAYVKQHQTSVRPRHPPL